MADENRYGLVLSSKRSYVLTKPTFNRNQPTTTSYEDDGGRPHVDSLDKQVGTVAGY